MAQFMFATGIENSYSSIEWEGKTIRHDELEKTCHYECWREDFKSLMIWGSRAFVTVRRTIAPIRGPESTIEALRTKPFARFSSRR